MDKNNKIEREAPKITRKSPGTVVIGSIIVAIIFIAGIVFMVNNVTNLEITRVRNSFVDIDGDGLVDYVIKADVIFNTGDLDFFSSQLDSP